MQENKMGYVPIPKLIPSMALPLMFSMLVQALYNVVDSIYVSRIGEGALTALSLAFPVQMIVVASFVGLSVGVSSAISRKLGAKDNEGAGLVAETASSYRLCSTLSSRFSACSASGISSEASPTTLKS